ncbi:hypothetical protein A9Q84_13400 [Halobacteriovorax marinus]|uniref:histidine kinase n=1 Tax=Halobacteriovorax marinus TaxID=97084 RepID=A0A1Y5F972_9BACT|nr:hypothetical protein A9Q84_13400 [Halobacteriovorax marinus]
MEVSNVTLAAYIDTLKEFGHDPSLLVSGTDLSWDDAKNAKKKHNWEDFVTMTDYVFDTVGEEKALGSINKTGVLNEELSTIRKMTAAVIRPENIYWFFCNFICKYMYKNVKFEYKKLDRENVQIKVTINEGFSKSQNFIKAYATAFEGFPACIGYPDAVATVENLEEHSVINLKLTKTTMSWNPFKLMKRYLIGVVSTSKLLNEIEEKRYEQEILNSQLESANQKLLESKKLNDTLIRAIMHDINNPLTLVRLKTEKLKKSKDLFSTKDVDILNRATNNMNNVIQNLRQFHIAQQSRQDETIDLEEAFTEVQSVFNYHLEEKNLTLEITSTLTENDKILGNKSIFITSILSNFISNAIKFSFEDSAIRIHTETDGKNITISIKDTGTGMQEDSLENFFSESISESIQGTQGEVGLGVGLTQALFFIKEMKGKVQVISKRLTEHPHDHGTEFILSFSTQPPVLLIQ